MHQINLAAKAKQASKQKKTHQSFLEHLNSYTKAGQCTQCSMREMEI